MYKYEGERRRRQTIIVTTTRCCYNKIWPSSESEARTILNEPRERRYYYYYYYYVLVCIYAIRRENGVRNLQFHPDDAPEQEPKFIILLLFIYTRAHEISRTTVFNRTDRFFIFSSFGVRVIIKIFPRNIFRALVDLFYFVLSQRCNTSDNREQIYHIIITVALPYKYVYGLCGKTENSS